MDVVFELYVQCTSPKSVVKMDIEKKSQACKFAHNFIRLACNDLGYSNDVYTWVIYAFYLDITSNV